MSITITSTTTPPTRSAHDAAMRTPAGDILRTLTHALGIRVVAHAMKVSESTVRRWAEVTDRIPEAQESHLRNLFMCFSIVNDLEGPHVTRAWFIGMNPDLDDEAPVDVFRSGRERDVLSAARTHAAHA